MNQEDLHTSLTIIRKDFNLSEKEFELTKGDDSEEALLKQLTLLVERLINEDFGRLIQVLYRIDIPEEKLKAALAAEKEAPATLIAKMIFKREMQKVKTKKRFHL